MPDSQSEDAGSTPAGATTPHPVDAFFENVYEGLLAATLWCLILAGVCRVWVSLA